MVKTCNDTSQDEFTDAVSCGASFLVSCGVLPLGGLFGLDRQQLVRSKGKSKAVDVMGLFQWTGYACGQMCDANGDGDFTISELSVDDLDLDRFMDEDLDRDGDLDGDDLALSLAANCVSFPNVWFFNIAELVANG
jgi:hypothetical protein